MLIALIVKEPNLTKHIVICRASLMAQVVKCLLATQETWVQSLGWEGALEKEMATHSSFLAWEIPWSEEPGRLQSMGSQRILSWVALHGMAHSFIELDKAVIHVIRLVSIL